MAFNVPTSGQWISFPTNIEKCVTVEWKEKYVDYSAVYYVTRCFWGYLEKQSITPQSLDPTTPVKKSGFPNAYKLGVPEVGPVGTEKKLIVQGSTDLFIASEYYDDTYKDGGLPKYHIQELRPKDSRWITLKLNSSFHYGQNGEFKSLRRFIVYHPINPPAIFQHRFTGLKAEAFFRKADVAFRELPPLVAGDAGEIISKITGYISKMADVVKAVIGHFLHQFLDEDGMEDARNRWRAHMKTRASQIEASNKRLTQLLSVMERKEKHDKPHELIPNLGDLNLAILDEKEVFILAVQIVESTKATEANDAADKEMKQRWLSQIESLSNVLIEGHKPPTFEEFEKKSWTLTDSVNDFIDNPEMMKQLKEARVLMAGIQELQRRAVLNGADQSFKIGVEIQADINYVQDSRAEMKRVVEAYGLKKSKSEDNLNLAKEASSSKENGKVGNLVQKNAGMQEQTSKNVGRNLQPLPKNVKDLSKDQNKK